MGHISAFNVHLSSPGREMPHTFRICRRVNHQDFLIYAGYHACAFRHRRKGNGRPAGVSKRQKGASTMRGKIRRDIAIAARETTRGQA